MCEEPIKSVTGDTPFRHKCVDVHHVITDNVQDTYVGLSPLQALISDVMIRRDDGARLTDPEVRLAYERNVLIGFSFLFLGEYYVRRDSPEATIEKIRSWHKEKNTCNHD